MRDGAEMIPDPNTMSGTFSSLNDPPPTTLEYVRPGVARPKPTLHSRLVNLSLALLIFEPLFRGSLAAYANYCSPTWPWVRFASNVGPPILFIRIDQAIFIIGASLALAAICRPFRKRWAAVFALAAHLYLLYHFGGLEYDFGLRVGLRE